VAAVFAGVPCEISVAPAAFCKAVPFPLVDGSLWPLAVAFEVPSLDGLALPESPCPVFLVLLELACSCGSAPVAHVPNGLLPLAFLEAAVGAALPGELAVREVSLVEWRVPAYVASALHSAEQSIRIALSFVVAIVVPKPDVGQTATAKPLVRGVRTFVETRDTAVHIATGHTRVLVPELVPMSLAVKSGSLKCSHIELAIPCPLTYRRLL